MRPRSRKNKLSISRYETQLDAAMRQAARALAREGYFGPVGFDSFVYKERLTGTERLAPIIEVNARHVMSDVDHAPHEKIGRNRYCLFRLINRKKCSIPQTYPAWERIIGPDRYDPLRVGTEAAWVAPSRNVFFIMAQSAQEAQCMDSRLRAAVSCTNGRHGD